MERHHRKKKRKPRKDAVLHLRIEGDVMERIKIEAEARGMSVSDLVRSHLAEHFPAATETPDRPAFLAETYAWVDVVVAQETKCATCRKALPPRTHARLAQGPPPPTRVVCGTCYDRLQAEQAHDDEPPEPEEVNHDE
jgi:hypothetical protein